MRTKNWCFYKGCDTDRPEADKFCWKCGARTVKKELPICPCGKEVTYLDHFCSDCGRPTK